MVIRIVRAKVAKAIALQDKIIFYENHFTVCFSVSLLMKYFNLKNNIVQIETHENSIKLGEEILFG